jgi:hypothetical protein
LPAMPNGRCRLHNGKSPGAPKGNTNAFKQGRFLAEAIEARRKIAALLRAMSSETRWLFTPDAPWQRGAHSVRVVPGLEDICGNTPYRPFDATLRWTGEMGLETAISSISFEVKVS